MRFNVVQSLDLNAEKMTSAEAQAAADTSSETAMKYRKLAREEGGISIYLRASTQSAKCVNVEREATRISAASRRNEILQRYEYSIDLDAIPGDGDSRSYYNFRYLTDRLHLNRHGPERMMEHRSKLARQAAGWPIFLGYMDQEFIRFVVNIVTAEPKPNSNHSKTGQQPQIKDHPETQHVYWSGIEKLSADFALLDAMIQ